MHSLNSTLLLSPLALKAAIKQHICRYVLLGAFQRRKHHHLIYSLIFKDLVHRDIFACFYIPFFLAFTCLMFDVILI